MHKTSNNLCEVGHLLRFWPAAFLRSECKKRPPVNFSKFQWWAWFDWRGNGNASKTGIWVPWVTLMVRMAQLLLSMETKISIWLQ